MDTIFTIDIGNTHTHCATVSYGAGRYRVLSTADYPSGDFARIFAGDDMRALRTSGRVAWCSVVPKYSDALREVFGGLENFQLTCATSPIEIDTDFPEQVGQDRIADAVGAGLFFEPPYIAVDMGTAVTIDLVDARGRYAGGVIAPGMHAFTDCKLADGIIADIERDFFGGESAKCKTVFTGGSVPYLPKKWLADRRIESNLANLGLAHSFLKNVRKK